MAEYCDLLARPLLARLRTQLAKGPYFVEAIVWQSCCTFACCILADVVSPARPRQTAQRKQCPACMGSLRSPSQDKRQDGLCELKVKWES